VLSQVAPQTVTPAGPQREPRAARTAGRNHLHLRQGTRKQLDLAARTDRVEDVVIGDLERIRRLVSEMSALELAALDREALSQRPFERLCDGSHTDSASFACTGAANRPSRRRVAERGSARGRRPRRDARALLPGAALGERQGSAMAGRRVMPGLFMGVIPTTTCWRAW
jgi:hypothetical protein